MAGFAEAEADALDEAYVAHLPLSGFDGIAGEIGRGPLNVITLRLYRLRIDFVGFLFLNIQQQVALPEFYQEDAALFRMIDVPRLRGFVIEAHDCELHLLPHDLFVDRRGLRERREKN